MFSFAAGLRRMRAIAALAAVILGVAFAAEAYLVIRDRGTALDSAVTAQSNMALGLERDILRNFDIYDMSLRAAGAGMRLIDPSMDAAAQNALLFDGAAAVPYFLPIIIADKSGVVLRDANSSTPRISSVADRPSFLAHHDRDGLGLLVRLVTQSSIDGRSYMSLTRRMNGSGGQFAGTMSGGLELGYFRDIFSRFSLPQGGAIALVGYDGRLVAGYPFREDMAGRDVTGAGLVARARESDFASFETTSVVDGVTRLATVRRLGTLPFFLAVGLPSAAVYAEWRVRAWATGASLVGFATISCLLLAALSRELARREAAERDALAAADAVRASEQRLGTYIDHLADGIMITAPASDGQFVYERINAAAATMLGIKPEDAMGRHPREVWPEPLATSVESRLRECLAGSTPLSYERTLDVDGAKRVVRFVLAPLREKAGDGSVQVTLILGCLHDITETRALEDQLRRSQRMEAIGQLTAGVAHEFNNMLQAQSGALELLMDDVRDRPDAVRYAGLALAASERGARLTHSLLAFSRQQLLAPRPVPLDTLLGGLRLLLAQTLGPRIELLVDAEEGVAPPFADPAPLEAALLNLALNARDAMPGGGRLVLEVRSGSSSGTPPEGMTPASSVVLAVWDTGVGMAPEVAARACEPFFTTKAVGKGSGLGLAMVQGFVQQSGGTMRILSTQGRGTCVELWLPQAAGGVSERPAPEPARIGQVGAGRRVLLVDDAADVLALTAELLVDAGFDVVKATDGDEALALLRTQRGFDILVTDYMMPGMDGGELVRRAIRLVPGLPGLVLTGFAESDVLRGLPPDTEVARKPIRGEALIRRVQDILCLSQSGRGPVELPKTHVAHAAVCMSDAAHQPRRLG